MEEDMVRDFSSFRSEDIDCTSSRRFEPKNDVVYNKDSFFNRASQLNNELEASQEDSKF